MPLTNFSRLGQNAGGLVTWPTAFSSSHARVFWPAVPVQKVGFSFLDVAAYSAPGIAVGFKYHDQQNPAMVSLGWVPTATLVQDVAHALSTGSNIQACHVLRLRELVQRFPQYTRFEQATYHEREMFHGHTDVVLTMIPIIGGVPPQTIVQKAYFCCNEAVALYGQGVNNQHEIFTVTGFMPDPQSNILRRILPPSTEQVQDSMATAFDAPAAGDATACLMALEVRRQFVVKRERLQCAEASFTCPPLMYLASGLRFHLARADDINMSFQTAPTFDAITLGGFMHMNRFTWNAEMAGKRGRSADTFPTSYYELVDDAHPIVEQCKPVQVTWSARTWIMCIKCPVRKFNAGFQLNAYSAALPPRPIGMAGPVQWAHMLQQWVSQSAATPTVAQLRQYFQNQVWRWWG